MFSTSKKGILMVFVAAVMFGSYGIWARLIGDSFGNFYQGWTRAVMITLGVLPILLWKKQIIPIQKSDYGWFGVFLLFTSGTQAPLFYAFNHMDVGTATLLFFVSILIMMYIVGFLFLKEKLTVVKLASFLLACLGMYFVFSISLTLFTLLAASMAVINGIASGGEAAFSKKLSGNYSALYLSWLGWVIIAITNIPISIMLGEVQHIPSFDMVWLIQIGYAITSVLGFWLVIKGLQYVESSIGGLIGLLEIVISMLLGYLVFKESVTLPVLFGSVLIIFAAALPHLIEMYRSSKLSNQDV